MRVASRFLTSTYPRPFSPMLSSASVLCMSEGVHEAPGTIFGEVAGRRGLAGLSGYSTITTSAVDLRRVVLRWKSCRITSTKGTAADVSIRHSGNGIRLSASQIPSPRSVMRFQTKTNGLKCLTLLGSFVPFNRRAFRRGGDGCWKCIMARSHSHTPRGSTCSP